MSKMIDRDALCDAIIKEFENEELTHEEWRAINHILNIVADAEIATEREKTAEEIDRELCEEWDFHREVGVKNE